MCSSAPQVRVDLPDTPAALPLARQFLRDVSCAQHQWGVTEESVLLVSELVTNAVRHGLPPVSVRVDCQEGNGLLVEISDGSGQLPTPRSARTDDESGRGMELVDLLSSEWGARLDRDGKTVWFRLAPPVVPV